MFEINDNDLIVFKNKVDIAKSAFNEIVLTMSEARLPFSTCVAIFENLLDPVNEMRSFYSYYSDLREGVSDTYSEMNKYYLNELSFVYTNKGLYSIVKNSTVINDSEVFYKRFMLEKFEKNGINLKRENKEDLIRINCEISDLEVKYQKNLQIARRNWSFTISDYEYGKIEGVLKKYFKPDGDRFSMPYSVSAYANIMKKCSNSSIRKRLEFEYNSICQKGTMYSNEELLYKIVELCYEKAKIFDFENPAQQIISENMGKTPDNVLSFLYSFNRKSQKALKEERNALLSFAKNNLKGEEANSHSLAFIIEKYKESLFSYNENGIIKTYHTGDEKKYLPEAEECLPVLFELFKELYDFDFEENKTLKVEDYIKVVDLFDNGQLKAHLLLDLYERPGKKSGAWATTIIPVRNEVKNGKSNDNNDIFKRVKSQVGILGLSANFEKGERVTFSELKTLLHEFGHCLHYAASQVDYGELAGTVSIARDAAEIPSMVLEKFYSDPVLLKKLSNKKLPTDMIKIAKEESAFMVCDFYNRRLIAPAIFDLKLFSDYNFFCKIKNNCSVQKEFVDLYKNNTMFGINENTNFPFVFTHLFGGKYKSGYYGYFWADAYSIDAFTKINKNRKLSISFKEEFLSKGSSGDPALLYRNFSGDDVDFQNIFNFYGVSFNMEKKKNQIKRTERNLKKS